MFVDYLFGWMQSSLEDLRKVIAKSCCVLLNYIHYTDLILLGTLTLRGMNLHSYLYRNRSQYAFLSFLLFTYC